MRTSMRIPAPTVARVALACLLLGVAAVAAGCDSDGDATTASAPQPKPNVVLIQADDETLAALSRTTMPNVERLLARPGTKFKDYIVPTPQCCPSRAALLTGEYGHNNGVTANNPGYGTLRRPGNILPVWLRHAGYVTAHVGKYLNGYSKVTRPTRAAPGWNRWQTFAGGPRYYDFDLASRQGFKHYGHGRHDYVTKVLAGYAERVIGRFLPRDRPLYLQVDEHAPHIDAGTAPCTHSATPAPRDVRDVKSIPFQRTPSFNERNVSDKPSFIRDLPRLDARGRAKTSKHYRCAIASLREVDRSVGDIYDAVDSAGELDSTIFVFISDNGYFFGEHRITHGKSLPYEEALRQPLIMRVPSFYLGGAGAPGSVKLPTANIDLAPTIVDLAGACRKGDSCRVMDGRSLVPLLEGHDAGFRDRDLLVEFNKLPLSEQGMCRYAGVRSRAAIYVRYADVVDRRTDDCVPTDQAELYDLARDPFELQNRYPAGPGSPLHATQAELEQRLTELRDCAGIAGRDPKPPSGHYCD